MNQRFEIGDRVVWDRLCTDLRSLRPRRTEIQVMIGYFGSGPFTVLAVRERNVDDPYNDTRSPQALRVEGGLISTTEEFSSYWFVKTPSPS
jgi:hypothetical protein